MDRRRAKLIGLAIVCGTVLVILGHLTADVWMSFVAGVLKP